MEKNFNINTPINLWKVFSNYFYDGLHYYSYIKYFNNQEELNNVKYKRVIEEILRLGSQIDLWNIKIDEPTRQRKVKESEEKEE